MSSHQAYDLGAEILARRLAKQFNASVHCGSISRLLIDLNRSPTNKKTLFSAYSRKLQPGDRELLLKRYYFPYRHMLEGEIKSIIGKGVPTLHIAMHSFAPVKKGKIRKTDIGLLYDPVRKSEKDICAYLAGFLQAEVKPLRVRRNYPYLGKTDGFPTFLRKRYSAKLYAGIEIEINQELLSSADKRMKKAEDVLTERIGSILKVQNFSQLKNIA